MWPFNRKKKKEQQALQQSDAEYNQFLQFLEWKSVSLPETSSSSAVGQPQFSEWSVERAISDGYKASTWEYACVTKIMDSASSVPWKVQEQQERMFGRMLPKQHYNY